ncbi:MAG: Z1 domain-containing protein [Myxococcota bacterium]
MTIPGDPADPSGGSVEVVLDPNTDWPIVGAETGRAHKPPGAAQEVVEGAVRILRRSADQNGEVTNAVGLVVGYVQSGKTASFTTLCALAHDNQFPLVIVIGGTSVLLFDQSNRRLQRDLNISGTKERRWLYVQYDMKGPSPRDQLEAALRNWRDPNIEPWRRRTVLLSVMKHHGHLRALVNELSAIDLGGIRTVVVDDEGDQAGLNTLVNRNEESTTYRQIQALRRCLPHHAYLLYTATPQAPLLINLIDALSPDFAEVLTPGAAYTGGRVFFPRDPLNQSVPLVPNPYVRTIPLSEIPANGTPLTQPPSSFLDALAVFWTGVAAGAIIDQESGNRSMMIHPHQTRNKHNQFFTWAQTIQAGWAEAFGPDGDPAFRHELTERFRSAYDDLVSTGAVLPTFERLVQELPMSIRGTSVLELNSRRGQTPRVEWDRCYAHILAGGQAMDRGFTVEGLTVTYMPRGLGDSNADTIQQRARFFGYKKSYLGLCRVWLESDVRTAFEEYVEHEEHVRGLLVAHGERPLRDWRRAFFLHPSMKPTRRAVLDVPFTRDNDQERWVDPARPHDDEGAILWNNAKVRELVASLEWRPDHGHAERTPGQRHLVTDGVPLEWLYKSFLSELRYTDLEDSARQTALLLQIDAFLGTMTQDGRRVGETASCSLYQMGPIGGVRSRGLRKSGDLLPLYQGANPSRNPGKGTKYPGDTEIRHSTSLTVQLHRIGLHDEQKQRAGAPLDDFYVVAVYVPGHIGKSWLVQEK